MFLRFFALFQPNVYLTFRNLSSGLGLKIELAAVEVDVYPKGLLRIESGS